MNPTLEKVRAKVIEAVPEIVELKFGCRIQKDGETFALAIEEDKGIFEKTLAGYWMCVSDDGQAIAVQKGIRIEIIGRPITLADVLRAIPKRMYLKTIGDYTRLVDDGDGYVHHGPVFWDLTRPSLDEQEPEVWEFLLKVLNI